MSELFDVYTKFKEPTGRLHERGKPMKAGDFRFVVQILIFNAKNELLIQQRCQTKEIWPNLWAYSATGSVVAGETSQEGAQRELEEELGLRVDFSNEVPALTIMQEDDGVFIDYYVLYQEVDLTQLTLQKEEVQAVRWANQDTINVLLEKGEFVPYVLAPYVLSIFCKDSLH